jgi:hypothetical protein
LVDTGQLFLLHYTFVRAKRVRTWHFVFLLVLNNVIAHHFTFGLAQIAVSFRQNILCDLVELVWHELLNFEFLVEVSLLLALPELRVQSVLL